ncbi:MAG: tyrosine-type recombinase/integrase [Actinomycetota bacterium]|nr:tyrosine-type recombinase/integrase [Actinomycetota bacterium]
MQREIGGGVEIRPPKWDSERTVYLPGALVQLLAQHIEQHRPGDDPARWLFEGEPGDMPHHDTVGCWWRKARAAAGAPGVKLHVLRHYFASGCAANIPAKAIQAHPGHSSDRSRRTGMGHPYADASDAVTAAMGTVFAGPTLASSERRRHAAARLRVRVTSPSPAAAYNHRSYQSLLRQHSLPAWRVHHALAI